MNNKQKKKSYFDVRNKYITRCKKSNLMKCYIQVNDYNRHKAIF